MINQQIEYSKLVNLPDGSQRLLIKAEFAHELWVERSQLIKLRQLRKRELAKLKQEVSKLRGLIADLD